MGPHELGVGNVGTRQKASITFAPLRSCAAKPSLRLSEAAWAPISLKPPPFCKGGSFDGELEPGRAVPRLGAYPEVPELNGRSFMVGLQADMAAGKARGMRE
jgi:hypothetical protein